MSLVSKVISTTVFFITISMFAKFLASDTFSMMAIIEIVKDYGAYFFGFLVLYVIFSSVTFK